MIPAPCDRHHAEVAHDAPRGGRRGGAGARAQQGAALFTTFLLMLILSTLAMAIGAFSYNSQVAGRTYLQDKQAFYLAEAGIQRARQALEAASPDNWTAGNTYTESLSAGQYQVTITDNGNGTYDIASTAGIPNLTTPVARRTARLHDVTVTITNTNLSLPGTTIATASSTNGGNVASRAKDADMGTFWEAGTQGNGQWLRMDFGSAVTYNQVIVEENNRIDGVTIESSTDGSTWTTVSGLTVTENPNRTWTCNFDATTTRYVRGVFTASGPTRRVSVEEFETYNTASGSTAVDTDGSFTTGG